MEKKYRFGLEIADGGIKKNIGYFNKIESLIKAKNHEEKMKKIRLYDGTFTEPYLYKDIFKDDPEVITLHDIFKSDPELSIILYDINFNRITTLFIKMLDETKISYNKNFSESIIEGEYAPYYSLISPMVMSLWLERCKGIPTKKDTWLKLSRNEREEWLSQIASDGRLNLKNFNIKIENKILEINGKNIDDEVSFYFAFGELVYGAGGYMGSNIHAFEDCLCCDKIKASTLTLIWNDFKISKKGFYKNNEEFHFKDILDVLNEQGVKVIFK